MGGRGLALLVPAAPDSVIFHHIHTCIHAIKCCKQGCDRVDLASMKSWQYDKHGEGES